MNGKYHLPEETLLQVETDLPKNKPLKIASPLKAIIYDKDNGICQDFKDKGMRSRKVLLNSTNVFLFVWKDDGNHQQKFGTGFTFGDDTIQLAMTYEYTVINPLNLAVKSGYKTIDDKKRFMREHVDRKIILPTAETHLYNQTTKVRGFDMNQKEGLKKKIMKSANENLLAYGLKLEDLHVLKLGYRHTH